MCTWVKKKKCYGQQNQIAGFGGLNENLRVQCAITIYTEFASLALLFTSRNW